MKENSIEDRIEKKYTKYLNCETDILELTIEETIFILETDEKVHYVEDLLQEAYKVILSDYKRALKENEHKTEKIENQKAELAILKEKQKDFNKLQNTLSSYKGQFRRQEKEIEELKGLIAHKNEYTKKLEEDLFENSNNYVIPIQKVKDKITEELKQKKEKYGNCSITMYEDELVNRDIRILQELIEEREEK